jgi:hypothetical protein
MTRKLLLCCILAVIPVAAFAQSGTVIFHEPGFPAADSAPAPDAFLQHVLPGAQFATAAQLKQQLPSAKMLVLPYGSAFPESAWTDIQGFLHRGGNLLVIGGRPFSRAAYQQGGAWKLRDYSVRYTRPLLIDQYQETPGSDDLKFESNPDIPLDVPRFAWNRGFSPIIHLSAATVYTRIGSAGSIDSNLDALAWGTKDGCRMSAPVIQIDHFRNGFDGGRWIFVDAELAQDFYTSMNGATIVSQLAERAELGAQEFTVRPHLPLYLPGEPIGIEVKLWPQESDDEIIWTVLDKRTRQLSGVRTHGGKRILAKVHITVFPADHPQDRSSVDVDLLSSNSVTLPAPSGKGLYTIEARLDDGERSATYRSAFWIRDLDYLHSGPKLSVNQDYFELDGKPLAVVGTTYSRAKCSGCFSTIPTFTSGTATCARFTTLGSTCCAPAGGPAGTNLSTRTASLTSACCARSKPI